MNLFIPYKIDTPTLFHMLNAMTIYELKRRNIKNGGLFFSRENMKAHGDTLKNFGVEKLENGKVRVYRKNRLGNWIFDAQTGRYLPETEIN